MVLAKRSVQKPCNPLCNGNGAFVDDKVFIKILCVVFSILNFISVNVTLPGDRTPALQIAVKTDAENFIRCEEAAVNALLQAVCINRFSDVIDI